jgi:exodeoxyribonuclease VII large subunit
VDLFEQRKIYSVFALTTEIKGTLEKLGIVWVQGEISNFKHHSSGHMYFSLKDDRAQIKAACFRNSNLYLKFRPEDGLEVIARGRVSVYEPRGDYQLIVEYMEPKGLGSLQLAFEQLKEKLRKEGLFDQDKKIPLPLLPQKIGIVTSPTGAAIRDILRILKRRNASLNVLIYPAKVQGSGAAEEIAEGIRYLNSRADIDVIIVGRGGGSIEDLWAFNEEIVARSISQSKIPIISAVGHEVDFTIADFVADLRAPTPSAAAELVSGARDDLRLTVQSLGARLLQAMRRSIEGRRLELERLARNRSFNVTPNMIRDFQQRFDEATLRLKLAAASHVSNIRHREQMLYTRLVRIDLLRIIERWRERVAYNHQVMISSIKSFLQQARSRVQGVVGRIDALSPLAILQRGYAICRDAAGGIVKEAGRLTVGERVEVILARGGLDCRVENIKPVSNGAGAGGSGGQPPKTRQRKT